MTIETVKLQDNGYLVNGNMYVPEVEGNRHYKMVQEWIAEGNTPETQYTEAEIITKEIADNNQEIYNELIELDRQSIRDIREWIASQIDAPQSLKDRETAVINARGRLR